MDEKVIKYYRHLLRNGFNHSGVIENATLFLDSVTEQIVHCGNIGNYMQLYVHIEDNLIDDIKYICSCDPPANVAVEILCTLAKGKTLKEVAAISEDDFTRFLGSESAELRKRAEGLLELLHKGISRYGQKDDIF
ncbi:MAG TPA: iron-sulfur cluster assembly scaffold protein [Thermodesulfobacteriota bacterium]|nr:iron-sulfur cluster assembly scaffold protein [Thermodesulfobacteriota bacterium]